MNFEYDQFSPAANSWGTIYPIPDKRPYHSRLKRRGYPPKIINPGAIRIVDFAPPRWTG
jgi:hypothetical protein